MKIAVTGSTGHIGNNVIRLLLDKGHEVTALVRRGESDLPLQGLQVKIVQGDLSDPASLEQAFAGNEGVFHLAGRISISPGLRKELYETNVKGTQNVVDACKKTGVRRLVYTSSIHAFNDPPKGGTLTEKSPADADRVVGNYAWSKVLSTQTALQGNGTDLEVIVVHPSGAIGPNDFLKSRMGNFFVNYLTGRLPVSLKGVYDFTDVRDIAMGHLLAMEKGKPGEQYLLTGRNISISEFVSILQKISGKTQKPFVFPLWFAKFASYIAVIPFFINGKDPIFTPYSIYTLSTGYSSSSEKARRELGYSPRPLEEAVAAAVDFYRKIGRIK